MDNKKTGMRCSVKFCRNKASDRNTSFFKYPNDERLATWIYNCKTEELIEALNKKNSYKVCGEHFEDKMFLNTTIKNRLVFNAIPTKFNDKILFERKKAEIQFKVEPMSDDGLKNQSGFDSLVPKTEYSSSRSIGVIDISKESCSSTAAIDFSSQTPEYFSSNTPRKQKMVIEINSRKKEIKNLEKIIVNLSKRLSQCDTEEHFLKLSKKYLSPGVFAIVKSQVNNKRKKL